jgi:hypothetical protein
MTEQQNKLFSAVAVATGLKVDPKQQERERAELHAREELARRTLAVDKAARNAAYAGAAVTALTLFGLTIYFLRHTISAAPDDA